MKTCACVALLVVLTGCNYNDHILIAAHDIPAGTLLQRSDFGLHHGRTLRAEEGCLSVPFEVIGHKTLRRVEKGKVIHPSDIEGGLNTCPEHVADGWDGERY